VGMIAKDSADEIYSKLKFWKFPKASHRSRVVCDNTVKLAREIGPEPGKGRVKRVNRIDRSLWIC
jgi:hypothetical protein